MGNNNFLSMLTGNNGFNPLQLLKLFSGNNTAPTVDSMIAMVVPSIVKILYKEYPKENKNEIFVDDPKESQKRNAVKKLMEKSIPNFIDKLNPNDVSLIFNEIQKLKD